MSSTDNLRNGYDAFISHNREDKAWARELAGFIANTHLAGRPLRPWLDEQYLDPGALAREAELTSALDRSRTLLLVLSPASIGAKWVKFELEYFLRDQPLEDVIPLLRQPCELPSVLEDARPLDFTDPAHSQPALAELTDRLCPTGGPGVAHVDAMIDEAWVAAATAADARGFSPGPSPERDDVLAALLRFDIADPFTEGLALAGFWHAAELLLHDEEHNPDIAYTMKMLLGECLAVALHRHPRYRQVVQRYLDQESADSEDPVLAFVVTRASSKLADVDPALLDLGALLRVAAQLDARPPLNNKKESVAMLLGRIAGKIRGTDLGDLLIQTLSEGGPAGRVAAIGGITLGGRDEPVFYVSELASLHSTREDPESGALVPPSRKLQALLSGIDVGQPPMIRDRLDIAEGDLRRAFGIEDLPYSHFWLGLRKAPPPHDPRRAPFMGAVARATTANMEELALRLEASDVVCLTEPRIVDALLEGAGSLLIPVQDEGSPQVRRLTGRGVPFAMLDAERMAELKDGDLVEIEGGCTRVVSNRA